MPHVPLKVLRGEQDQEDIQDKYHEIFQAPGTSTEEAEADNDPDDESRRRSLSLNDVDVGETGEEGIERYLGGSAGSIDTVIQLDNEAVAQVHQLPSGDDTKNELLSNDDSSPLLTHKYLM